MNILIVTGDPNIPSVLRRYFDGEHFNVDLGAQQPKSVTEMDEYANGDLGAYRPRT